MPTTTLLRGQFTMFGAQQQVSSLLTILHSLPDFRDAKGREFPLVVLGFALFATELANLRSQRRRARWLHANWNWVCDTLRNYGITDIPERSPSQATLSRFLKGIDFWALIQRHLKATRAAMKEVAEQSGKLRHYAVDGKRREGIRSAATGRTELDVTIFDVETRTILAKSHASDKRGEGRVFHRLLRSFGIELPLGLFTMDAGLTSPATFAWLRSRNHEYLAAIKGNCGNVFSLAQSFAWEEATVFSTDETGHGRRERRELRRISLAHADAVEDFDKYADCGCVLQLKSMRTEISTGKTSEEVRYFIVSKGISSRPLPVLAAWTRGHWSQENHLHWAKDAILGEDDAREKSPRSSRVLGFLKDIVISISHSLRQSVSALTDLFQFRPSAIWQTKT